MSPLKEKLSLIPESSPPLLQSSLRGWKWKQRSNLSDPPLMVQSSVSGASIGPSPPLPFLLDITAQLQKHFEAELAKVRGNFNNEFFDALSDSKVLKDLQAKMKKQYEDIHSDVEQRLNAFVPQDVGPPIHLFPVGAPDTSPLFLIGLVFGRKKRNSLPYCGGGEQN